MRTTRTGCLVTAHAAGTAVISASSVADPAVIARSTLVVSPSSLALRLTPSNPSVPVGWSVQLTAIGFGSGDPPVTCTSGMASIATVEANETGCVVRGVGVGAAVIMATSTTDPALAAHGVVTVTQD